MSMNGIDSWIETTYPKSAAHRATKIAAIG